MTPPLRRALHLTLILLLAACIYLPSMHLIFRRNITTYRTPQGLSPVATQLAATYLDVWNDPTQREQQLARMRKLNPEWDFMSRTYLVLAFANMALRDPAFQTDALTIIDAIIADTLQREQADGHAHFLLAYGNAGHWVADPPRSIFVDGEIALMIGARRLLQDDPDLKSQHIHRTHTMIRQMQQSPVLCAESYPDECWLFCNTVALAAIRISTILDHTDHNAFLASWVTTAKTRLLEPTTGILISAFAVDGEPAPCAFGPEGSSIWMATHMLQIVDPDFASQQYALAKKHLARSLLGFGYSREWPKTLEGPMDIDSGPVIPLFGASASASGLSILAAAAFDDTPTFTRLMTSLKCAGFPTRKDGRLRYLASNPVGDAVLLYAMTEGPLWDRIQKEITQ